MSRMKNIDKKAEKIKKALLGIFPNIEAFLEFKQDDPEISNRAIPEFIKTACNNGLIKKENEDAFIAFLEENRSEPDKNDLPAGLTFEDLMRDITEGSSVNTLIAELNLIARQFRMSNVQGSMFSRLKRDFHLNTPAKRNCIRILSFWIGKNRPFLNCTYETIFEIPRGRDLDFALEEVEGVRIAFRLEGRGEIIDTDVVEWLKSELSKCMNDLKLYHIDLQKITCFATTIFLTIPKKPGRSGEPRLYEEGVRDSMTIAHQILNRFYLSAYSSMQKALIVAIDAGRFVNLDASLQVLLEVKLPEDPAIRLTSFVRLCSRLSDNRVIFSRTPKELKAASGNILTVWYVECFWTFFYYDFIPCLLEDDMLPTTHITHAKYKNALHYPYEKDTIELKTLFAIHKFPENDLMILEIAKVCIARRMFHAANTVLSTILASNPRHMVARTLRMSIFLDIAMEQTKYSLFELYYQRAIDEGNAITEICSIEDEEFYCEFGAVHYLVALRMFSILKNNTIKDVDKDDVNIDKIFEFLDKAEKLFRKGTVFSPPGIGKRCNFLRIHVRCFKIMLKKDPELYLPGKPLIDRNNIYETVGNEFITFLGWTDLPFTEETDSRENKALATDQVNMFLRQIVALFQIYESSVHFRHTFPSTKFTFASMVFDFSPFITVKLVKLVISWLEQARVEAEKLKKDKIGVYVLLSCFGRIQTAENYITFIDMAIKKIKIVVSSDLDRDDNYLIDKEKLCGLKLILLSLEDKVEPGIIV
jgi:hypothetical protein